MMCAHQRPILKSLLEELDDLPWCKAILLAIHLDIDKPTLNRIEEDYRKSPRRLVEFLDTWLNRDTGVSWENMAKALDAIKMCKIATAIRSKYCRKEPLSLAAVASSTSHQSRSLPPTPQPTPHLAQADHPMTESSSVNSQGCITGSGEALPANNSDKIQNEVVAKVNAMEDQFILVLRDTKIHFSKKKSKTFREKFCCELTTMPVASRFKDMHFLKEKEEELRQAKDSDKIFSILQPYMSYDNYSLLQHIINRFGDQKLKKKMEKYISELEKFEKYVTVQEYRAVKPGSCPNGYSSVEIKAHRDPAVCSVYECRRMIYDFVKRSTLNAYATFVESICPSSVTVTFGFPRVANELIRDSITDPQFIKTYMVTLITVNEQIGTPTEEYDMEVALPHNSSSSGDAKQIVPSGSMGFDIKEESAGEGEKMDISPESIVRRKRLPSASSVKGFPRTKQMRFSFSSAALEYREGKWARLYKAFKNEDKNVSTDVSPILDELQAEESFIVGISRYMKKEFKSMAEEAESQAAMFEAARTHKSFHAAKRILAAFEIVISENDCSACAALPLLVLLSQDVQQLYKLILQLAKNLGKTADAIELFYCMSTLFFGLWRKDLVLARFHYLTFHAVYVYEREIEQKQIAESPTATAALPSSSSKGPKGKSSEGGMKGKNGKSKKNEQDCVLTVEQRKIAEYMFGNKDILKVVALAGTGKTTALVEFAKRNDSEKILYVAFNKSIVEDAKKKFPKKVTPKTFHSIAYKGVRVREQYEHKRRANFNVFDVKDWLKKKNPRQNYSLLTAKYILKTLQAFYVSGDDKVLQKHMPKDVKIDITVPQVESLVTELWTDMCDPGKIYINLPYDGYLKLYQLRKEQIEGGYSCILVDEAQDLSAAQLSIVMTQKAHKVFVGDPHQQIYSFRGAMNALDHIDEDICDTLYLTQSFRFGPNIAYIASCILDKLKHERKRTMIGKLHEDDDIYGKNPDPSIKTAVITRTNATLFDEMVKFCGSSDAKKGQIGFVGGKKGYNLKALKSVYLLLAGKKAEIEGEDARFLRRFSSIDELQRYAYDCEDYPTLGRIATCKKYGEKTLDWIEEIEKRASYQWRHANVIFSTCHKAKGLEFDSVKVTNDYHFCQNEARPEEEPTADERNLIYVAVTRAKKYLTMPPQLVELLCENEESFIYPNMYDLQDEIMVAQCCLCKKSETAPLQFKKMELNLSDGRTVEGGAICSSCVCEKMHFMKPIFSKLELLSLT